MTPGVSADLDLDWQPKQFSRTVWCLRFGNAQDRTTLALKGAGLFKSKQAALDYLAKERKKCGK